MATPKKKAPKKKQTVEKKVAVKKAPKQKQRGKRTQVYRHNEVDYDLEEKEWLFALEYVRNGFHGTNAAIFAGYSANTATSQASRVLARANVQGFVQAIKDDIGYCLQMNAVKIAAEYAKIGFSDIRALIDDNGNVIPVKEFSDATAANVASIEVFEEYEGFGEERTSVGQTKKVKFYDKISALDKLSKMIGVDGVKKVAAVNPDGTPATPASNVILVNPKDLPTEVLEKLMQDNEAGD